MKITNETKYRTEDFRMIIWRVAKEELDQEQRKHLVVVIRYRRAADGDVYGRCYGRGSTPHIVMYISRRRATARIHLNPMNFAHGIAHELAHCRGMTHEQMRGSKYDWRGPQDSFAWARGYEIRSVEPKSLKSKSPDLKLTHARAMLLAKERQTRRLQTLVKKWRQKVAYYERRLAAAAQPQRSLAMITLTSKPVHKQAATS